MPEEKKDEKNKVLKTDEEFEDSQVELEQALGEIQIIMEQTNEDSKLGETYERIKFAVGRVKEIQELEKDAILVCDALKTFLEKQMVLQGISEFRFNKKLISRKEDPKFNILKGDRPLLFEFLRENGRGAMIYDMVNPGSLNAYFSKEYKGDLPSYVTRYDKYKINGLPIFRRPK